MQNGSVNDFVNHLNYGVELFFIFNGFHYLVEGWYEEDIGKNHLMLCILGDSPSSGYVWEDYSDAMSSCSEKFLEAKIFFGKSFWEIEKDIFWEA